MKFSYKTEDFSSIPNNDNKAFKLFYREYKDKKILPSK